MSSPVNTVSVDGWDISGTDESASDMLEGLSGPDEAAINAPHIKVDRGQPVEAEEPKEGLSKAASELGKKGGEAAAKAKAKAAREAKKEAKADDGDEDDSVHRAGSERTAGAEAKTEVSEEETESGATSEAQEPSKRGNPRHDPTARVAEATRQAKEARERAERAEREASEYRYRLEQAERAKQPAQEARPAPSEDAEPQEGDFENYSDYVKALARHEYKTAAREAQQQYQVHAQAAAHVQRVTQTADAFKAALAKAAESDPELHEKLAPEVMNLGPSFMLEPGVRPGPHNWIADDLLSAPDRAPGLMLYLSEHPAEFQRIAALSSPRAVTRELAILSVKLSDAATNGTSSERRVSKAKPPVTPLTGSPHTASDLPDDEDDYDTHVRKMNALEKRQSRR